jgi:ferric-dicitrate binding protein FerR (iron transport regulator)
MKQEKCFHMNKIQNLINKLIGNIITPEELKELNELLNEPSSHKEAKKIISELHDLPRAEKEGLTKTESFQMIENILSTTRVSPEPKPFRSLIAVVTIAVLVLAMTGVWIYNGNPSDQVNAHQASSIKTFRGKGYIHLPDGSTVLLNEGTELSYSLTNKGREVNLRGEAYFDVAHDPSKPFRVLTGKIVTTVLGTAFNVNANSTQNIVVTVTRGKVAIGDGDQSYGTIIPNEQLTVNTSTKNFVKSQVDSQKAIEWKADYLIIDNITFTEAASLVEKRFNVKVTIANPALRDCIVTGLFSDNESLKQIVEGISAVQQATATIKGDSVTIEGGTGCKPLH